MAVIHSTTDYEKLSLRKTMKNEHCRLSWL